MKKIFLSVFVLFIVLKASSQSYPFDSIPENLKRRASAVVRTAQCQYTILKPGNAIEKVRMAVTILNEKAESYRNLYVYYDKFSKINYLRGTIYDEKGKIIKVLGLMDVYDESAMTGGTFYSDDRTKNLYFPKYKYPFTVEYEYEKEYTSVLNYPDWHFQDSYQIAVERSGIQIIVPKNMILRYYTKNLKNNVDSVITEDSKIYTWLEENIQARVPRNYFAMETEYSLPVLFTAPMDFEYGGIKGSMSSWQTFGEWRYNLIKGRDVLPQTEIDKVKGITSKTDDPREKAKLIYEYMQSKTRYVSIQEGIGGYRPADATAVATNGFGDCKALVNYTKALFKAAGITSYYAVTRAGEDKDIRRNFVANQFNHIILCVPMQKDTVWLECTSQTLPFNYLGSFTDDRYALLITPEGGKLVRTPEFRKSENVIKRTGTVTMYGKEPSLFKLSNSYEGFNYGEADMTLGNKSEEEIKRLLYSDLRYSDFTVSSVSYAENKSEKPSAKFSYGVSVNDFTNSEGKRLYFNPGIVKEEYLQDFPSSLVIAKSQIIMDSITYYIPYGYKVEFLPAEVKLDNEFGKFSYKLEANANKIIYKRYLEMNKGIIPAEKFNEVRNFVNTIAKADRERIILKN
jgi:transglutaminase-like putative cysteine protease